MIEDFMVCPDKIIKRDLYRFQGHFILPIQRLAKSGRKFAEFHPRHYQVHRDGRSLQKRTPGTCSCLFKVSFSDCLRHNIANENASARKHSDQIDKS